MWQALSKQAWISKDLRHGVFIQNQYANTHIMQIFDQDEEKLLVEPLCKVT